MPRFASYVITWADEVQEIPATAAIEEFAVTARENSGALLALGAVRDASELDARPAPRWMTVAGFADDGGARAWFDTTGDRLGATTILAPALSDPVWWPEELSDQRPDWSWKSDPPAELLGVLVVVWANVTDPTEFFDYSTHYKWTVEHAGGACLAGRPGAAMLRGATGPDALAVMSWPADGIARHAWYDGAQYRPYKLQRHRSSRCTNVSIPAR